MFKLFAFLFNTIPQMLSWLYFLIAALYVFLFIRLFVRKSKISAGQLMFSAFNIGYIILFMIMRVFFPDLWETIFSVLGLLTILISSVWSAYEEKREGRRWWNW